MYVVLVTQPTQYQMETVSYVQVFQTAQHAQQQTNAAYATQPTHYQTQCVIYAQPQTASHVRAKTTAQYVKWDIQ